jgi:transposase
MAESEIIKAFNEGLASVVELVTNLTTKIEDLEHRLEKLETQNKKTSKNSHKPPSTDGFKKTQSLRRSSGKKQGGQHGHEGTTLKMSPIPDEIIVHEVDKCSVCGESLKTAVVTKTIKRQVFDLVPQTMHITEHQVPVKICGKCQMKNQSEFPEMVTQPTQYGASLSSLVVYLHQYQLIPYARLQEMILDVFHQQMSRGTLVSMVHRASELLVDSENFIKEQLIDSDILHLDETGCYVNKKRWWLHVSSNKNYTYYYVHQKRGKEALDDIGILKNFRGTAIHDSWAAYFQFDDCTHSLCNAHHLREFQAMEQLMKQKWASQMTELLLEAKTYAETHKFPLAESVIKGFKWRYDDIVCSGYLENPLKTNEKNTEPVRLLNRLVKRQEEVLEFLYQRDVPFDNNLAERDCRMTKVKQKISGTFRSEVGAHDFARIRGIISTCKKQGGKVLDSLFSVFSGINPQPIN